MTTARDGTLPRLENWSIRKSYSTGRVAYGNIYNDTRFADGTAIRTSSVQSVDGALLRTRNTLYELGKKANSVN